MHLVSNKEEKIHSKWHWVNTHAYTGFLSDDQSSNCKEVFTNTKKYSTAKSLLLPDPFLVQSVNHLYKPTRFLILKAKIHDFRERFSFSTKLIRNPRIK